MTTVKALRSFIGPGGKPIKVGATVELDNGLAQNLILRGRAEPIKATKPAKPPAEPPAPPADPKTPPPVEPPAPPADPKTPPPATPPKALKK